MKIKNRQQTLAILAAVGVILLVGDKLVLSPLTGLWKERTVRIAGLKKSVQQGSMLVQREQSIRSHWEHMRTNTLPDNVSAAENQMLRAFDRWSQESRVSIASVKSQWKRNTDDYATLEYRADASGNIQALTRFLYNAEKDPLAIRVESVEITARDNNGELLSLGLQVSGLLIQPQEP